jgi:imidazolonepropionase-like amidohydrolase
MQSMIVKRWTMVALSLVLLSCGGPATPPSGEPTAGQPTTITITGVRLIDGTGAAPIEDAVVVIQGDRIHAAGARAETPVPSGGETIDGAGKTIIPGLVEMHAHYNGDLARAEQHFKAQLYYGVTTSRSMGLDPEGKMAFIVEARARQIPTPRVYTAGLGFGGPEGGAPGRDVQRPTTPERARQNVDFMANLAPYKADFIKMWIDGSPRMAPDVRAAIVAAAQRYHIPVTVHIRDEEDARQLITMGVKDFVHTVNEAGPEFMKMCVENGVVFSPILVGLETWHFAEAPKLLDDPALRAVFDPESLARWQDPKERERVLSAGNLAQRKKDVEAALRFTKTLADSGGRIAVGSDSGAGSPSSIPMGWATHREMELLVRAGLTPMQAIVAATRNGAEALSTGESDYGTLRPGKIADLLVLDANPLEDIKNTQAIGRVMQGGKWLERKELLPRARASS